MKTNYKLIVGILAMFVIASLVLPGLSFAQREGQPFGNSNKGNNTSANANKESICSKIEDWANKIDQNISDKEIRIQEKRTERNQIMDNRREERDAKLIEIRNKWEANRAEQYAKLLEKAQDNEQRQAVIEFKQDVEAAIAARKAAVDKAISDFRDSLDQVIAGRKTAIDAAKATYRNAYQVAVQKGVTDCAAGVDANQVRTTLRAALRAGREEYNEDRQAVEKMDVKALVEIRQEAFEKALEDFKTAMQEAREELKAAFTETEETE